MKLTNTNFTNIKTLAVVKKGFKYFIGYKDRQKS